MTIDLHTAAIEGFFSIAVEHLNAVPLLAEAARPFVEGPSIVVAPDLGAVKLAKQYAQYLELPLAIVHKIRQSGETVSVQQVVGDVRDRALVIVDDMLSTGGTVAASMNALLAAGCTPRAIAVVSHGLFVGRAEHALLPLPIQHILTTDSVASGLLPCRLKSIVSDRSWQRRFAACTTVWSHRRDRDGRLAQAALSDRSRSAPSPSRRSPNRSTCPWSRCSQYSQAAPSIGSDAP